MPYQRGEISPNKVIKIRSDIIREEASLRKKLYDDVYFKKNKRDHSPTLLPAKLNRIQSNNYGSQSRVKT